MKIWMFLIAAYTTFYIVYEGGVLGVLALAALFGFAIWAQQAKNKTTSKQNKGLRPVASQSNLRDVPARPEVQKRKTPMEPATASRTSAKSKTIDGALAQLPLSIRGRSGSVFYTGKSAFTGKPPLYILGLNPGGSPTAQVDETVERDLADWHDQAKPWSAYIDESWQGKATGTHGMQPHIIHMFELLGLDLRAVPASNVVFARSSSEAALAAEKGPLLAQCWPVHAAILETLNIDTILCLGGTAGRWVRHAIGARQKCGSYTEQNARGWTSEAHLAADGRAVITVTHPGRADWRNPAADPTELVKAVLKRVR